MAKRKKSHGPHIDKHAPKSAEAQAELAKLNKRWEPRQAELNKFNRSASLMSSALNATKQKVQHCKFCGETAEACKNDSQGVGCVYQLACGEYHRPWDDQDPESYIIPDEEERYILV